MSLWIIEPCARRDDSRWLDFPLWTEVVVRAGTAAEARLAAAAMEAKGLGEQPHTGNESLDFRSGFTDEKLYRVRSLQPEEFSDAPAEGPAEVLSARKVRSAAGA